MAGALVPSNTLPILSSPVAGTYLVGTAPGTGTCRIPTSAFQTAEVDEQAPTPLSSYTIVIARKITLLFLTGYSAPSTVTLGNGNVTGDTVFVAFTGTVASQNVTLQNASSTTLCIASALGSGAYANAVLMWNGTAWLVQEVSLNGVPAILVANAIFNPIYLAYQGTWNATTNIPAIPAAASWNAGWFYRVATAGTTSISGIASWGLTDILWSDGDQWNKINNNQGGGGAATTILSKSGDTSATGTYTLDPDLQFAVAANARFSAQFIFTIDDDNSDMIVGFLAPAGCTVNADFSQPSSIGEPYAPPYAPNTFTGVDGSALSSFAIESTTTNAPVTIRADVIGVNGSTAGTFGLATSSTSGTGKVLAASLAKYP